MQNANANANSNSNCSYPNVFPVPTTSGCEALPYDGMAHDPHPKDIYSRWSEKNSLGPEKKYKYWNTCKAVDQKNVWGTCKPRGGVNYNSNDHKACDSRMNKDNVTEASMLSASDAGYAKLDNGAYKSLLGNRIDVDGNNTGSDVRDYYVYGLYTASGGFVKEGSAVSPKCNQKPEYYGYMKQKKEQYVPYGGPTKKCGGDGYKYANGQTHPKLKSSGSGVSCEGLYRNFEDHNEQYMKEHYDQYKSGLSRPSQAELDTYQTNFMLLSDPHEGTTRFFSFGEDVNPKKMDGKVRESNSHLSL